MVFAVGLQDDGDDGHDGLEHAELQRRLVNGTQHTSEDKQADGYAKTGGTTHSEDV